MIFLFAAIVLILIIIIAFLVEKNSRKHNAIPSKVDLNNPTVNAKSLSTAQMDAHELMFTAKKLSKTIMDVSNNIDTVASLYYNTKSPIYTKSRANFSKSHVALRAFINFIDMPGCVPCGTTLCKSCGYYSDLMALTKFSQQSSVNAVGSKVPAVVAKLQSLTPQLISLSGNNSYLNTIPIPTPVGRSKVISPEIVTVRRAIHNQTKLAKYIAQFISQAKKIEQSGSALIQ
jgi:uncharacterized protein (UPF0333 family)